MDVICGMASVSLIATRWRLIRRISLPCKAGVEVHSDALPFPIDPRAVQSAGVMEGANRQEKGPRHLEVSDPETVSVSSRGATVSSAYQKRCATSMGRALRPQ